LQLAPWPGNVRQLRHVIERACLMSDGRILTERELAASLAAAMGGAAGAALSRPVLPKPNPNRMSTAQREQIERVLQQVRGNKTAAAQELGMSRRSLYRWLDRLEIPT
jgi:DNA-binding NtrC family response regulator